MKDDNLKLEFQEKLKNIIDRTRETDNNEMTMKIFSASLGLLFYKYLFREEFGQIEDVIDSFNYSSNPEEFKLLVDMIEKIYL